MGIKPSYVHHEGFRMPMGFPLEAFSSALAYRAAPDDIFISTYPKCGTTWVQNIVYLISHDGVPLPGEKTMTLEIPHLEEVGAATIQALQRPRCIKTHLPFSMTPHHEEARYIYVARNPFDCAVSFYHHTRGFTRHYNFAEGTFDDFFECFVAGEVDFGDYFDNLMSWYAHRDDSNVLFLTYEAMKSDTRAAVTSIGEFLGAASVDDETVMADILRYSSFESMSENQDRWSSRRPEGMPAFIRKGIVGDWMNHFSPQQTRRLLEKFLTVAGGTNIESLWPEIIVAARRHAEGD